MKPAPRKQAKLHSFCLGFWMLLAVVAPATGHGLLPNVLSLVEVSPDRFLLTLRSPLAENSDRPLPLRPRFPAHCRQLAAQLDCRAAAPGATHGLHGQPIAVERTSPDASAEAAIAELIVVITWHSGRHESTLLRPLPGQDQSLLSAADHSSPQSAGTVALRYLRLGIQHILDVVAGADHLLFLLALMLLVPTLRALVLCVSAFTLGHSLTLAAASLDLLRLPAAPIEALIALSIVFVAKELHAQARLAPSAERGSPPNCSASSSVALALSFGLLHGLGFAGALAEAGLPTVQRAQALFSFNVGVEFGQLLWLLLWLPLWRLYRRYAVSPQRLFLRQSPAYVLGSIAAALTLSRLLDVFHCVD